ncbi:MAG: hypothetical protein KAQ68_09370 [Clostridiales bacterium]|nr:hypothetical protein [Clostridiales bacterium]
MKKEVSIYCAYPYKIMNVLLIGEINCGKSTIINAFLAEFEGSIVGYKTIREKTQLDDFFGIYLLDINNLDQKLNSDNKVGDCFEDKTLFCHKDVFERLGIKALKNHENTNLVIMDELGVLESKCNLFQSQVHQCLDSKVNVLGVIKPRNSPFLDSIRSRPDVKIIEVSKANNTEVLDTLKEIFRR